MYTPEEIWEISAKSGEAKVAKSLRAKLILGFLGGAVVAMGYLAYVRTAAAFAGNLAGLGHLIGAGVFPVGLMAVLLAGGELVTGNMMAVSAALIGRRVSVGQWAGNFVLIALANGVGAVFVAYVFGHVVGLTATGAYAELVVNIARHKLEASALACFFSGIGCNWFVGLGVWLCYGAKTEAGKYLGIWFPVMTFVVIGFQHSVANLFILPAAIFLGYGTWGGLLANVLPVFLGNVVGGGVFVALLYSLAYRKKQA